MRLAGSEAAVGGQMVTTPHPWLSLSSLLPWSRYRLEVSACNLIHGQPACAPLSSSAITFRTQEGRPGRPRQPQVTFLNSSLASISWSDDFPLGAREVSAWSVRIARVENNVTAADTDDVLVIKVGSPLVESL